MAKYNEMILTAHGSELLAKVIKGECDLTITRVDTGDGEYSGEEDLSLVDSLKNPVQSFGISSFERANSKVLIRFTASNIDPETEDYYIREVGIYAKGDGDDEILYCLVTADVPAFIPAHRFGYATVTFTVTVVVGTGSRVTVQIDPTAFALAADLAAYREENDKAVDGKLGKDGDGSDVTVAFDQAGTRENISTGEKLSTVLGKIAKFFTDLKKVAFSGSYNDLTDKPTIDTKLSASSSNAVQNKVLCGEINLLKKSVSDGKSSIASAITSHGVPAGSDATYAELASKIGEMSEVQYNSGNSTGYHNGYNAGYSKGQGDGVNATKKGDAGTSHVLSGKTFTSKTAGVEASGTMPNRGAVSGSVGVGGTYTIAAGYHNGSGKVTGPTLSGDAGTSHVLNGKSFYSNSGTKQTGAMVNRGAVSKTLAPGETYAIPAGYHNGSGKVANGVVCTISHVFGFGSMICFPDSKCCVSGYSGLLRYGGDGILTPYPGTAIECTNISVAGKYESCNQIKATKGGLVLSAKTFPVTAGQKYVLSVYWLCTTDSEQKSINIYLMKNPYEYQTVTTITNNAGWYYVHSCFEFTSNYTYDSAMLGLNPNGKQGVIIIALDIWKKT